MAWNHSIFTYNSTMQEMIAAWKYRGDYQIGYIFKQAMIASYKKRFASMKKGLVVVPVPLSKERLQERGFNQAQQLADILPRENIAVLERHHGEKQSKKSRAERIMTENPFELLYPLNTAAVLVDDIYTTGRTLRHAADLLKRHGCPEVYGLTLSRS
ncbi:ComF family protein [Virgibacillus xinjiangensis]|uniref:ComF family protein n=1 Tax=Virgibacillus xinjiangensis TaxID=393090 RepID=A0ABV7CZ92_9BACI